jgi:2-polyprenyl-3-methyl-5-hydroxy-6-metoxy-1,4-benzoquinol methylase
MPSTKIHPASYRDPSGYIFKANDGILYRQVNRIFQEDFDEFKSCGLYNDLVTNKILISHQQIDENLTGSKDYYTTLKPILIPFISYPYEWSFDMLKEAALLTLKAAKVAMKYNMMLKDASGYNVQWFDGKMIFIDTLSFEKWDATKPWVAYRQFCEHFLAPLALMHYLKIPLQKLLLSYPDGIPLSLVKKLLPFRSRFNLNTYLHLHLHATYSLKPSTQSNKTIVFSKTKQENLLQSLEQSIQSFSLNAISGVWSGYYNEAREREDYLIEKKKIIQSWLSSLSINSTIDIGANEGEFSLLLAGNNIPTISIDFDHYSINQLYRKIKENSVVNCTPLIIDFSNPSPAIGLNSEEHSSFLERIKVDLVLALAVVHHLAIGKNIPFEKIAKILSTMGKYLIIEFVPKEDEKVELMVNSGAHIFHEYNEDKFLSSFGDYFSILKKEYISDTKRTIYLMRKHEL